MSNIIGENDITVLFAVTPNVYSDYAELIRFIPGSQVGELTGNSANIIELLKDQYEVCVNSTTCCSPVIRIFFITSLREYFVTCRKYHQQ